VSPKIVLALTPQPRDTSCVVTVKQPTRAGHGDYVTATADTRAIREMHAVYVDLF